MIITTAGQSSATDLNQKQTEASITTSDNTWRGSRTAVIVGGAVEIVVFVVAAVLIGCYVVKNKQQNKRQHQTVQRRVQNPSGEHQMSTVAMTVRPITQTYAEISEDNGGYLVPIHKGN